MCADVVAARALVGRGAETPVAAARVARRARGVRGVATGRRADEHVARGAADDALAAVQNLDVYDWQPNQEARSLGTESCSRGTSGCSLNALGCSLLSVQATAAVPHRRLVRAREARAALVAVLAARWARPARHRPRAETVALGAVGRVLPPG